MSSGEISTSRNLWLDLLRGAAAIGVLSFHVVVNHRPQLDGLYVLVDFFFVLSGFVLYPSMLTGRVRRARRIWIFIVRRLLRLWPMLLCVLIVSNISYVISHYATHERHWDPNRNWKYQLAAALFLQVIVSSSMFMVVPLWSLSAELLTNFFYIPLAAMKSSRGIYYGIFIGYLTLNIGLTMDQGWIGFIGPIRGCEAIGRAILGFGIGLLIRKNLDRLKKFRNPVFLVISGYGAWWALFANESYGYNTGYFAGIIFALFVLQVSKYELSGASPLGKFASFMGRYSYGIYAFHQVMIDITSHILRTPNSFKSDHVWRIYFIEKCSLVCFLAIFATFLVGKGVEGPIQRWGNIKLPSAH